MVRILVVEDEPNLLDSLRRGLQREDYDVLIAQSLREARRLALTEAPDGILLDLMLPDGEGLAMLRDLRSEGFDKPVLILTARDSVQDRVHGLDAGADDYLLKPFAFDELLARLRALLRRIQSGNSGLLRVADLELDLMGRRVTRAGVELELTSRQFELLTYLMRTSGEIVTRKMIADNVWKDSTVTWTNVIAVQVNHLRGKIERPAWPPLLHTVRGEGYILETRP
ncbi:MAG: response regulator transcription factor [Planctomycetales bacterium]|nr:response regulator transcription factor [Planctomycetales bacterium]